MKKFIPGPAYQEMLNPARPPAGGLFNITWRGSRNAIRHVVLPKELTGVNANILVLVGKDFPSGSHKVGPAYATLMEAELAGEIVPGSNTIIGPSTGNFGIGTAYVSRLKGYEAIVIMPEGMSAERYERIRDYSGKLDLTPGSESDVILVLERTEEYKKDPRNKILAQFELFPNYRFHRYVTGRSVLEMARQYGNGQVAAFVSAPGSAGTLAAGDEIKSRFDDCLICAVEPKECSTLFNNGRGTHGIEGIGDKMVALIHNVLTTDYVMVIHDEDCIVGLDRVQRGRLKGLFGISGICNILGAIRLARYLQLGAGENVVTIATDGFDRYPSVLANLEKRRGPVSDSQLADSFEQVFRGGDVSEILDVRPREQKHRLFAYKETFWTTFNYSRSYLDSMKSQSFWDGQYEKIARIDEDLAAAQ
jgi:cysteine synthase